MLGGDLLIREEYLCDDPKIQMESQVPVECQIRPVPEDTGNKDGVLSASLSSSNHAAHQLPAKKQTRQWAAWTREEEESFFSALRQVGKNFEKITCRVQSKNKDQVRHYYYRLVRRMNKLLGPELCLDAKNSKDTNAAMLRWWSLLEQYSCKASKLHLKPRRFKLFLETLGNQLLKDRKKSRRKRNSSEENNLPTSQIPAQNQARSSCNDNRGASMVLIDSQNIQRIDTGKSSFVKRQVNMGMARTNFKPDLASAKAKQSQKKGLASRAAYKRWEKAASAGVSLVADAAEHLERFDANNEIGHIQETPGHDVPQLVGKEVNTMQAMPQSMVTENNHQNSGKLKLQLFPIDENTRKALELEHHNPHLELTLSTRKKISSVLEHLNRKWGNLGLSSNDLMLFPFSAQRENLVRYEKWTRDSPLCAADVYQLIGSPPIFRLRYGWFSKAEVESPTVEVLSSSSNIDKQSCNGGEAIELPVRDVNQIDSLNNPLGCAEKLEILVPPSISPPVKMVESSDTPCYHDTVSVLSSLRLETEDLLPTRQVKNAKDTALTAGDWINTFTNISVGDLLTESAHDVASNGESPFPVISYPFRQASFTCDSFDAAIAAHISKHQDKANSNQDISSHAPSSIWDAEETCDAFAFQRNSLLGHDNANCSRSSTVEACVRANASNPSVEELPEMEKAASGVQVCSDNCTKDFNGLNDVYWPDSLGPLDLDIPSCRYRSNDLILSDSLSGLNRFITSSSLDEFQSCSFALMDKKESPATLNSGKHFGP